MNRLPMIDNWEVTSQWGDFLRIEENSIHDMYIRGEFEVSENTFHPSNRKYKLIECGSDLLISIKYDDAEVHVFTLGNPSNNYSKQTGMTTRRFSQVMLAKKQNGIS
jgi:hypothetical protein